MASLAHAAHTGDAGQCYVATQSSNCMLLGLPAGTHHTGAQLVQRSGHVKRLDLHAAGCFVFGRRGSGPCIQRGKLWHNADL